MKKIIFLVETPESAHIPFKHKPILDRYNFTYEYWDARNLSEADRKKKAITFVHPDIKLVNITPGNLEEMVKKEKDAFFISGYVLNNYNRPMLKLFKRYHVKYITITNTQSFFHQINPFFVSIKAKNGIINYLYKLFIRFVVTPYDQTALQIQRPILSILGSHNDLVRFNYPKPPQGITFFHNANYERLKPYLDEKREDKTLVFIDQFFPYHPETQNFKWNLPGDVYYKKIEAFLLRVGEIMGLEPVIAAHPRAQKGLIEQHLKSVRVEYLKSLELIQNCSAAVLHTSSAIDQCILFNKPVVLLYLDEFDNASSKYITPYFSRVLKKKYINYDKTDLDALTEEKLKPYLKLDQAAYDAFIHTNIKPKNTPEGSLWDYVTAFINDYK